MNMHVGNKLLGSFPTILFRKKRLSVAIHAQFDLSGSSAFLGDPFLVGMLREA